MPQIVTFIGWHNSGKTTLATQVVSALKNSGHRIAVIKSSKEMGIIFDSPGTDTDKHRQAGADSIMFIAPDQMVMMTENSNLSLSTLAHRYFPDVDIVIGEGFKQAQNVAKIEVVRNKTQLLSKKVPGVIAIATDLDISGDHVFRLNESEKIASFIEKRFLKNVDEVIKKDLFNLINSNEFPDFFDRFSEIDKEYVPLKKALHRFLAQDIPSPEALPPFSRSTMDGYAVRAQDTFGCSESEPVRLKVIGEIPMGVSGQEFSLKPGQAASIWTGGELAEKADAVVMIEYCTLVDKETIEVFRAVTPGENVMRAGEDFEKGEVVLSKGRSLRPQDLGVLAGLGIGEVPVFRKPVVGIISTGNELVETQEVLAPGKIRNINTTTLSALVSEAGGIPLPLGIIHDDFATMLDACKNAIKTPTDILLVSGGSSAGKRDFTLSVFKEIDDSDLLAHSIAIRPGKPTILAKINNCALFGLPGHVASAMMVFYLFVRPILRKFSGATNTGLRSIVAAMGEQIHSPMGREEYIPIRLTQDDINLQTLAYPVYGKSGLLKPLVTADGLLFIPNECEGLKKGDNARVLLFPN